MNLQTNWWRHFGVIELSNATPTQRNYRRRHLLEGNGGITQKERKKEPRTCRLTHTQRLFSRQSPDRDHFFYFRCVLERPLSNGVCVPPTHESPLLTLFSLMCAIVPFFFIFGATVCSFFLIENVTIIIVSRPVHCSVWESGAFGP